MIQQSPKTMIPTRSGSGAGAAGRRRRARGNGQVPAAIVAGMLLCGLVGCAAPGAARIALEREVEAAARPLLEMHADANWTACYNRLLELGPVSVDYLLSQPIMRRTAAPDDLRVMLHTSLLRLLASPARAPRLSVNCFETTLDVLHFDPKVRGQRLGEVYLPTERLPAAWHDLYPTDFDHGLAQEIDVEADRRAMLLWCKEDRRRGGATRALRGRPLRPRPAHLWAVLSRRYADVWVFEPRPGAFLCAYPPTGAALFHGRTYDYNLVRAACIWLASAESPGVERELIELVGHPSPTVAYNARFALAHSRDPRVRELIERYEPPMQLAVPGARCAAATRAEFARVGR
jgi:hypothetical protein